MKWKNIWLQVSKGLRKLDTNIKVMQMIIELIEAISKVTMFFKSQCLYELLQIW
jgi:hypothetical protein